MTIALIGLWLIRLGCYTLIGCGIVFGLGALRAIAEGSVTGFYGVAVFLVYALMNAKRLFKILMIGVVLLLMGYVTANFGLLALAGLMAILAFPLYRAIRY